MVRGLGRLTLHSGHGGGRNAFGATQPGDRLPQLGGPEHDAGSPEVQTSHLLAPLHLVELGGRKLTIHDDQAIECVVVHVHDPFLDGHPVGEAADQLVERGGLPAGLQAQVRPGEVGRIQRAGRAGTAVAPHGTLEPGVGFRQPPRRLASGLVVGQHALLHQREGLGLDSLLIPLDRGVAAHERPVGGHSDGGRGHLFTPQHRSRVAQITGPAGVGLAAERAVELGGGADRSGEQTRRAAGVEHHVVAPHLDRLEGQLHVLLHLVPMALDHLLQGRARDVLPSPAGERKEIGEAHAARVGVGAFVSLRAESDI